MKQHNLATFFLATGILCAIALAAYAQDSYTPEAISSAVVHGTRGNAAFKRLLSSETTASYIAGLRLDSSSKSVCVGALIAPSYVLTTHCYTAFKFRFGGWTIEGLQVAIGIPTTGSTNGEVIKASKLYSHPEYNMKTRENEFFIVKLSEASKLTPVTLRDGDGSGIIYGSPSGALKFWAKNENLQTTAMSFMNPTVCANKQSITDTHLCASAVVSSDTCDLEPGDLLMQTKTSGDELVGLMSFNNACGSNNTPVVFSEVSKVREWIKSIAGV